jgi:hypothetical protein
MGASYWYDIHLEGDPEKVKAAIALPTGRAVVRPSGVVADGGSSTPFCTMRRSLN